MDGKVLIANRGEIALRVVRACRELGIPCVVATSQADRDSLAVRLADESVCIGAPVASESYLRPDRILAAALQTGATAIHPGYGFLSESAHFAELCAECGLIFIGPTPKALRQMGDKTVARKLMQEAGVPVMPGSDGALQGLQAAFSCAEKLGYPVILKASAGGGGRGMRVVRSPKELENAYRAAGSEAEKAFGDGSLFMERFAENPKHVEVQVFGDAYGKVVYLGERDCSMQRHHQKLIEESPCIAISAKLRKRICETAAKAARSIGYCGAGTVEFLLDATGKFYFMEMNTRIQVEHPVTEMVTGLDLVKLQLQVALDKSVRVHQHWYAPRGHAIEIRINAEDPLRDFAPSPGVITHCSLPGGPGVRMDSHVFGGYAVPPCYDSLLGKLIVWGETREEAVARAHRALRELDIRGVATTRAFTDELLSSSEFLDGRYTTDYVSKYLETSRRDLQTRI